MKRTSATVEAVSRRPVAPGFRCARRALPAQGPRCRCNTRVARVTPRRAKTPGVAKCLCVVFAGLQALVSAAAPQDEVWSLAASHDTSAAETVLGQRHQPRRETFALRRDLAGETGAFAHHEYRVLDLPLVRNEPADTNGHVHRLALGWQQDAAWRLKIAAALAVSSNALKHLNDIGASDIQPDIALERETLKTLWLGLRADDRFGRTLVYPTAAWRMSLTPSHAIAIGIPDSSWRWRWSPAFESVVSIAPDGGVWRVRDRDLTRRSAVRLRSWQATASVGWQPADQIRIEARIGRRFAGTLRYQLRDGTDTRVDVPDGNVFGITATLRF